ncbi:MAG: P-loop NTPase [Pseudomonadota bacterium]
MVKFETAIPLLLGALDEKFKAGAVISRAHIVRDLAGQLVLVLPDEALQPDEWNEFAKELHSLLETYSPGEARVLLRESDLIDPTDVLDSPDKISLDAPNSWLLDRVLTNQDWVRPPLLHQTTIPMLVAYSVKGGVGRSTAMAMLAWNLARKGKDVLVIDLDLEAPGIGSILLDELPECGLVDWLMESINSQGTEEILGSAIRDALLAQDTDGRIRVLAAYGKNSNNYISKLGRIYGSTLDMEGKIIGLAERLIQLLDMIANMQDPPDSILIDSRAGLHDIGSAVVTRLGAEVLLFARNDDQDWWSYHQLFEHLRVSQAVSKGMGSDDDLRWKLKMVAAQTAPVESARRDWVSRSYTEWIDFYDDESAPVTTEFTPQTFARDAVEAPHFPLFINFEPGIRTACLTNNNDRPNWDFIQAIYSEFFAGAEERLWPIKQENISGS